MCGCRPPSPPYLPPPPSTSLHLPALLSSGSPAVQGRRPPHPATPSSPGFTSPHHPPLAPDTTTTTLASLASEGSGVRGLVYHRHPCDLRGGLGGPSSGAEIESSLSSCVGPVPHPQGLFVTAFGHTWPFNLDALWRNVSRHKCGNCSVNACMATLIYINGIAPHCLSLVPCHAV